MKIKRQNFSLAVATILLVLGFGGWIFLGQNTGSGVLPESGLTAIKTPAGISMREIGSMDFRAFDKDGILIWEERDRPNNLADEGEYLFLDVTLRGGTPATAFYLRLFNDTPVETDMLADLTGEPTTNGYAAQLVEHSGTGWPTLALDSGDYQATSSTETFSASGGSWGPVTYCVLSTTSNNTGKLISYVVLSTPRTLASGESLQVTYKLKLQ